MRCCVGTVYKYPCPLSLLVLAAPSLIAVRPKRFPCSAVTKTSESLLWVFIMSEIETVLGQKLKEPSTSPE